MPSPPSVRRLLTLVALALAAVPATAVGAGRCGEHPWCDTSLTPVQRADLVLAQMSREEKVALLGGDDVTGVAGGEHTHTGVQTGVPRLDIPTVLYSDGPVGPRQGKSTGLPIPLALAATWNPAQAAVHGAIAASEARAKGNDVIFAPTVNIARVPMHGRTFEAYGEDPLLDARMAVQWTRAAQAEGVIADVKHFAVNNQEGADLTNGLGQPNLPLGLAVDGNRLIVNAVIDERTLREIYLPHFEAVVKDGGAGSVMCSYNRLNGQYACENTHLLQDILRREWGFDGYVLADYGAAHNPIASLNNGLDFEPFPPIAYQPLAIDAALASGLAGPDRLDEHVHALLQTWFRFGLFDRDAYRDDDAQIDKPAHAAASRRIEEQAITLLRNEDHVLPLDATQTRTIAVIGKPATTFVTGGGSGNIKPFQTTTPLAAIRERAGEGVRVVYLDGSDAKAAAAAAAKADVALVFAGAYYTEGADRQCLTLECPRLYGDQDALIAAVAAANRRSVVVLQDGGPVLTPWRASVAGLLEAWFPGAQGGSAIAGVLFGDTDPGGRLPITYPDSAAQLPTAGDQQRYPGVALDVHYSEGVFVGYRWYDEHKLQPAFPFGFGLSYTSFALTGLTVEPGRGGAATVRFTITNTGDRAGYAVGQLYLGLPSPSSDVPQPPAALKGFRKVLLKPGKSRRIALETTARDASYWDSTAGDWRVAPGCAQVRVGQSSRDVGLRGVLALGGAACPGATPQVCTSRRSVTYTLPRGARLTRLTVDGRRRAVRVRRGRVTLALRGLPRGTVLVRITTRRHARTHTRVSVLHPCSRRATP